jgi:uncharacterized protein
MVPAVGIAFKAGHFDEAREAAAAGLWFEVHAENYMVDGGPRLAMLDALRLDRPISVHGVGMSLGGTEPPDPDHLAKFKRLIDRYEPELVSEHLAWSRFGNHCFPDLLPVPRTDESLSRLVANVSRVQDAIKTPLLMENPSHYMNLREHDWPELEFLVELARRTGCRLLVDLNNIVVSSHNLAIEAESWIDAIPGDFVGEIHVAGSSLDAEGELLIDSHDQPIGEAVWMLLARLVGRIGARPTLIERDGNIPPFAEIMREHDRAQNTLDGTFARD